MKRYLTLIGLAAGIVGCNSANSNVAKLTELPSGTKVNLVLATSLAAGDSEKGKTIPFLVSEDLQVDGAVLVPKGTPVLGVITWSRSEGTLSGLMNQPARLEVQMQPLKVSGVEIPLSSDASKPDEAYAFTRANTSENKDQNPDIDDLLKVEANRRVMEKLDEAFEGKQVDLNDDEAKAALIDIARRSGLAETETALSSGKTNLTQLKDTISDLQRGNLSALANGDLSLSLNSVLELANLVGNVGGRLSRTLKGRTIHAPVGTHVTVYTTAPSRLPASPLPDSGVRR